MIFLLIIIIISGFLVYNYIYKSHRDISSEEASFTLTVETLATDFKNNEVEANAKYLDKTINVKGTITEIDTASNAVIIDKNLFVGFQEKKLNDLKVGSSISIKGRFIGYDELLEEYKIDQATIIK
ncbi:MAG: hypothetical protein HC854_16930 [Flavobacterium sp.]|nr:hypothetical protein [Flavobacterium sp.]